MTLKRLSARSEVSPATLSKIENGQLQPTYDTIMKLAEGLDVDVGSLFDDALASNTTRFSVTESEGGIRHDAERYVYRMMNTDLSTKKMTPLRATVKAGKTFERRHLIEHGGEECVFVLSGVIRVHTAHYAPRDLQPGDCAYFDSTMAHALEALGASDAEVFWICSSEHSVHRLLNNQSEGR